mmetsp:Transcript_51709/g.82132  ORF Transcript_51709/g.82132 Transcript_51709/m.82132 type:complete len:271 (-) Transcript_51709:1479-2291(-)
MGSNSWLAECVGLADENLAVPLLSPVLNREEEGLEATSGQISGLLADSKFFREGERKRSTSFPALPGLPVPSDRLHGDSDCLGNLELRLCSISVFSRSLSELRYLTLERSRMFSSRSCFSTSRALMASKGGSPKSSVRFRLDTFWATLAELRDSRGDDFGEVFGDVCETLVCVITVFWTCFESSLHKVCTNSLSCWRKSCIAGSQAFVCCSMSGGSCRKQSCMRACRDKHDFISDVICMVSRAKVVMAAWRLLNSSKTVAFCFRKDSLLR